MKIRRKKGRKKKITVTLLSNELLVLQLRTGSPLPVNSASAVPSPFYPLPLSPFTPPPPPCPPPDIVHPDIKSLPWSTLFSSAFATRMQSAWNTPEMQEQQQRSRRSGKRRGKKGTFSPTISQHLFSFSNL